jgi:redox-sensitive bicupin YhaK (pirin superfamily)
VSPADVHSPLVGAEAVPASGPTFAFRCTRGGSRRRLALAGSVDIDGVAQSPGLLYLSSGRSDLSLRADTTARLLLSGGESSEEHIVTWCNFVGRDHDDIATACEHWTRADLRFGAVHGDPGDRLPAPALPTVRLTPRGRYR